MLAIVVAMTSLLHSPNDPIAFVGTRAIVYSDVACPRTAMAATLSEGADIEAACRQSEQLQLSRAIISELRAIAADRYDVHPPADEVVPSKYRDESMLRQIAEVRRVVPIAVLRVIHGDPADVVFEEELSREAMQKKGLPQVSITRSFFDQALRLFRTDDDVARHLAGISDAAVRREVQELFVQEAIVHALREIVGRLAAGWNVPYVEALERFWCDLANELNVRVVDPHFAMPDWREML